MADPERGALMLVRVIAVAFLGAGAVNSILYALDCSAHHTAVNPVVAILQAWPALIGIVGLIKARAVAGWVSDWLDL